MSETIVIYLKDNSNNCVLPQHNYYKIIWDYKCLKDKANSIYISNCRYGNNFKITVTCNESLGLSWTVTSLNMQTRQVLWVTWSLEAVNYSSIRCSIRFKQLQKFIVCQYGHWDFFTVILLYFLNLHFGFITPFLTKTSIYFLHTWIGFFSVNSKYLTAIVFF